MSNTPNYHPYTHHPDGTPKSAYEKVATMVGDALFVGDGGRQLAINLFGYDIATGEEVDSNPPIAYDDPGRVNARVERWIKEELQKDQDLQGSLPSSPDDHKAFLKALKENGLVDKIKENPEKYPKAYKAYNNALALGKDQVVGSGEPGVQAPQAMATPAATPATQAYAPYSPLAAQEEEDKERPDPMQGLAAMGAALKDPVGLIMAIAQALYAFTRPTGEEKKDIEIYDGKGGQPERAIADTGADPFAGGDPSASPGDPFAAKEPQTTAAATPQKSRGDAPDKAATSTNAQDPDSAMATALAQARSVNIAGIGNMQEAGYNGATVNGQSPGTGVPGLGYALT